MENEIIIRRTDHPDKPVIMVDGKIYRVKDFVLDESHIDEEWEEIYIPVIRTK